METAINRSDTRFGNLIDIRLGLDKEEVRVAEAWFGLLENLLDHVIAIEEELSEANRKIADLTGTIDRLTRRFHTHLHTHVNGMFDGTLY